MGKSAENHNTIDAYNVARKEFYATQETYCRHFDKAAKGDYKGYWKRCWRKLLQHVSFKMYWKEYHQKRKAFYDAHDACVKARDA